MEISNDRISKHILETFQQSEAAYQSNPRSVLADFSNELRDMGFEFETLYHAITLTKTHGALIAPLALKYYQQATLENEKRYLLSWIPKQAASSAIPILLQDFYSDKGNVDRWAIADTLYGFASPKYWQEYLDIISKSEYGIDRQMLILLAGKLKIEEAIPVLITLLDDECVTLHALCALSRYKNPEFRGYFERFVNSPNTAWRKQAMKALQQLTKR